MVNYKFYVYKGRRPVRGLCAFACIDDALAFSKIHHIATVHWGWGRRIDYEPIVIEVEQGDAHLKKVFEVLASCGWTPFFGEFVPEEVMHNQFEVRRLRRYEKGDLESCDYLLVHRWGSGDHVFSFDGESSGTYYGKVRNAKWKRRYGLTYDCGRSPYFVNLELKQEIEARRLIGTEFKAVQFDDHSKVQGGFWQLSSSLVLPPCLLPLVTIPNFGDPIVAYDDGGFFPQELVFSRAAIETMEPFDIALTQEDVGRPARGWRRNIVISQRFRSLMRELGMSSVELTPVKLIEK